MRLKFKVPLLLLSFFYIPILHGAIAEHVNESILLLENNMQATHTQPVIAVKGVVLMIHGWASNMDEVGGLYARLAAELSKQGIASVRINVRGESEQKVNDFILTSTFESRLTDAKTGFDFLQQTYPNLPIGVVGFSLGGSTAIALVGENTASISSLVLWSSSGNPDGVASHLLSREQRAQVLSNGSAVVKDWATFTITKQHLLGFKGVNIFKNFTQYSGALLCIRGTLDSVKDIDRFIVNTASGQQKEYRHIAGANHIFNVFEPDKNYSERVLQYTVEWLGSTL